MEKRLRLSVFRSNKYIYAQIIDDEKGHTLVAASEKELITSRKPAAAETRNGQKRGKNFDSKTVRARLVGEILAKKALKLGIKKVKFDRRDYKYHGRVKALAEGARAGGLKF